MHDESKILLMIIKRNVFAISLMILSGIFFSCASVSIEGIPSENLLSGTFVTTSDDQRNNKSRIGGPIIIDYTFSYGQKIELGYRNKQLTGDITGNSIIKTVSDSDSLERRTNGSVSGNKKTELRLGSNVVVHDIGYNMKYQESHDASGIHQYKEDPEYNMTLTINGMKIDGTHIVKRKIAEAQYYYPYTDYEEINYTLFGKKFTGKIVHSRLENLRTYDFMYGDMKITGTVKYSYFAFKNGTFEVFDFKFGQKKVTGAYEFENEMPDKPNIALNIENLTDEELLIFMVFFLNKIPCYLYYNVI